MTTIVHSRRDTHRQELAAILERDVSTLRDDARLTDELALDSLAMMSLLAWLEERGVLIETDRAHLATVADVLDLLSTHPALSIRVTGGPDGAPAGPAATAPSRGLSADPLAPVLATHTFRLAPVDRDDLGFLYALAVHPETGFRWRYRGAAPPFDRFVAELWTHVLVQYVVRRVQDDRPVGLVVAYGPDEGLSHAHLGAVFAPPHAGAGLAAQVVTVFVRYLFHTFRLRKLYLEIPEFNWPQLRSGDGRLFQVEGVLRGHYYYAGRYWDKYVGAIYPDRPAEDMA